ncbi:hypothetical protein CFP65_3060 [Kitasatospora sp. MMS16-BH015]|uniref:PKD domain-containing protein n=1 Tax=Kitasatospora sp. MMS16-BH015 TaxID=2018025 RepID=UPI000CA2768B|nr:PKD domain-containing protein [Kitasatospora sp. MMS16-BH015]AUG77869.1 hypothetical protein CFP65_3060 [Kitasatospora sp. MMS16-BH015]
MRLRHLAGLATATVITLGIGLPLPAAVAASAEADPVFASMGIGSTDGPLEYGVGFDATSPSPIVKKTLDFGDGTVLDVTDQHSATHAYTSEGNYTVTFTATDKDGHTGHYSQVIPASYRPTTYTPVPPSRLLDTRQAGHHALGADQTVTFKVPSVPTATTPIRPTAVVLNVTAVDNNGASFLTAYPAGSPRPATSNVNFGPKQVVPNLVTVPVSADGSVTVYNKAGSADVVVDEFGVYAYRGDYFTAQAPTRLLDTRTSHRVGPDGEVAIQVAGVNGVPADATAAVLNVTTTGSDAPSYLTAYPSGTDRPGTSNLNFTAGQTVANQAIVPIGKDGKVRVYNHSGSTQVIADLFGYYGHGAGAQFTATTPKRLVDTRTGKGTPVGPGATLAVPTGVPTGSTGAVLNVTATAPTTPGYLTVFADKATRPATSNLNFLAGQTVPNHVTTPLGANGAFDVYNFNGSTQVIADLFGYFTK